MASYPVVPGTGGATELAPAGIAVTLTLAAVPRNASGPAAPDPTIATAGGSVVVVVVEVGVVVVLVDVDCATGAGAEQAARTALDAPSKAAIRANLLRRPLQPILLNRRLAKRTAIG